MTITSIGSPTSTTPFTVPPLQTTAVTPGAVGPTGATGAEGPVPWALPPTVWAADVAYSATAPASTVTYNGSFYVCMTSHVSSGAFDATKWFTITTDGGTF